MKIRLALADDHPMVQEGIRNMLAPYEHMEVTACYSTGKELLNGLANELPDVLLLDIHFPDTTGNELVRKIAQQYPQQKILAVTSVADPYEVQDMMQHGCHGYIQKSADKTLLVEAIETVYRGETFLEPVLKDSLMETMLQKDNKQITRMKLTTREQEIMELICQGLTNMDIAQKLFLSHRTVEHHRLSLYGKFGVNNIASLVKAAMRHKLIQ